MRKGFFWSWSLGARLIFIFVLWNMILPAFVLFFSARSINEAASTRLVAQLEENARLEARTVADYLAQQIATLRVIAVSQNVIATTQISNTAFNDFNDPVDVVIARREQQWETDDTFADGILTSPISQELARYQTQLPQITEMHVLNKFGATIAASSRTTDYSERDEGWFGILMGTGEVQITPPFYEEDTGLWGLEVAVPIRNRSNNTIEGAVSMLLSYDAFLTRIQSGLADQEIHSHLIDLDGRNIVSPLTNDILQPYAPAQSLTVEQLHAGGSNPNTVDENGESVLLSYFRISTNGQIPEIDRLGWVAALEQPHARAYALINDVRRVLSFIIIAPVLIALVAFYYSTRLVSRELIQMGTIALDFAGGSYGSRMADNNRNPPELRRLITSFNTMAERIQQSTKQLQDAEKTSRTQNQALVKANNQLAISRRQAEEATRIKSEFLATMSHELRTPLNAIIGYTEIQLAGMSGELNEEQQDYQNRVLRNGTHLLELINDILDLSKIEAGRIDVLARPFKPGELLNDVVFQTNGLIATKNVEYVTVLDPALPETVVGDYGRLKQILINLVSNAAKFTEQGAVTVSFTKQDDQWWKISIRDTGIGIPSHAQEFIFEEFRQVDGTMARRHQGTGLGLAIVRRLVLLMSGKINLKSKVGEGSEFIITLPLITEALPEYQSLQDE